MRLRRRTLLATLSGAVTGVAGCGSLVDGRTRTPLEDPSTAPGDPTTSTPEAPPDSPTPTSSRATPTATPDPPGSGWPTFGHDRRNTGFDPEASGPVGSPAVTWRFHGGTPAIRSPPVVADGTVYVGATGDPGRIHAVDAATGDPEWTVESGPLGEIRWGTLAPSVAGDAVYAATEGGVVMALDADDGTVRWERTFRPAFSASSPTVAGGTLLVGGDEVPMVLALDAATGTERWRFTDLEPSAEAVNSSPAVADGLVVVASDTGHLYALDAADGTVRWDRQPSPNRDVTPAVADGTVYYAASYDSPADREGVNGRAWALDLATGRTRWTRDFREGGLEAAPAVADGRVYVPTTDPGGMLLDDPTPTTTPEQPRGRLYALDAATGDVEWVVETPPEIGSAPAVADGAVYLGAGNGLSAVSTDGDPLWRVECPPSTGEETLDSSPAVAGGRVYVGCYDGYLYSVGGDAGSDGHTTREGGSGNRATGRV